MLTAQHVPLCWLCRKQCLFYAVTRFSIDLRTNPVAGQYDVALQINPRYKQDCVVLRNSFINGTWGKEECDGQIMPAPPRQLMECIVLITNSVIKVTIINTDLGYFSFKCLTDVFFMLISIFFR